MIIVLSVQILLIYTTHLQELLTVNCNALIHVSKGGHYHCCPLPSARQHLSYGDCLEVKRECCQNCSCLLYTSDAADE